MNTLSFFDYKDLKTCSCQSGGECQDEIKFLISAFKTGLKVKNFRSRLPFCVKFFNEICNRKHLEILSIHLHGNVAIDVRNFEKLKKLKHLIISDVEVENWNGFSFIKMNSVKKLAVYVSPFNNHTPEDAATLLNAISIGFPQVKYLKIEMLIYNPRAFEILQSMKHLQFLNVSFLTKEWKKPDNQSYVMYEEVRANVLYELTNEIEMIRRLHGKVKQGIIGIQNNNQCYNIFDLIKESLLDIPDFVIDYQYSRWQILWGKNKVVKQTGFGFNF